MLSFKEKVFTVVKKIPCGQTLTYKEVARRAGSLRACRVDRGSEKKRKILKKKNISNFLHN